MKGIIAFRSDRPASRPIACEEENGGIHSEATNQSHFECGIMHQEPYCTCVRCYIWADGAEGVSATH